MNYEPHENVAIDELLFPCRGKIKFSQFHPSKPAKYKAHKKNIRYKENYTRTEDKENVK